MIVCWSKLICSLEISGPVSYMQGFAEIIFALEWYEIVTLTIKEPRVNHAGQFKCQEGLKTPILTIMEVF